MLVELVLKAATFTGAPLGAVINVKTHIQVNQPSVRDICIVSFMSNKTVKEKLYITYYVHVILH